MVPNLEQVRFNPSKGKYREQQKFFLVEAYAVVRGKVGMNMFLKHRRTPPLPLVLRGAHKGLYIDTSKRSQAHQFIRMTQLQEEAIPVDLETSDKDSDEVEPIIGSKLVPPSLPVSLMCQRIPCLG